MWTRSRIAFTIFLISFGIFSLKVYVIAPTESDIIEKIFGFIMVGTIALGLINSLMQQQLQGKLEGKLIFDTDKIIIDNDVYKLNEIRLTKLPSPIRRGVDIVG